MNNAQCLSIKLKFCHDFEFDMGGNLTTTKINLFSSAIKAGDKE